MSTNFRVLIYVKEGTIFGQGKGVGAGQSKTEFLKYVNMAGLLAIGGISRQKFIYIFLKLIYVC